MVESGMITRSTEEWLMSRSCHNGTFSRAARALARRIRQRPAICSHVTGLRLCGIEDEPLCPSAKGSAASATSVRCRGLGPRERAGAGNLLARYGVALVRHRGRAPLPLGKGFGRLRDLRALQVA